MSESKVVFDKEKIIFSDGTSLSIFYEPQGQARMAMIDGPLPEALKQIKRSIRLAAGICCEKLRENLGNHNLHPKMPVMITGSDWRNGKLAWQYPGATGPGFYFCRQLLPTDEEDRNDRLKYVYLPMDMCPYCTAEPFSKQLPKKDSE